MDEVAGFGELLTGRLRLRAFAAGDAEAFAAYRSDPDTARYQSWDAPYPLEQARAFVREVAAAIPDVPGEWFQIAVERRDEPGLIGDVAVHVSEDDPRLTEVGLTFSPRVRGHGYATEAMGALIDHLLLDRGKHRVVAHCDARNDAARAVFERLGFREEGMTRQASWWKGEWCDEVILAVLASEWRASSGRPVGNEGA